MPSHTGTQREDTDRGIDHELMGIGSIDMDVAARKIGTAEQVDVALVDEAVVGKGIMCHVESVAARHHIAMNGAIAIGGAHDIEVSASVLGEVVVADHSQRVFVRGIDHLAVTVGGYTIDGALFNVRSEAFVDLLFR